MKINKYIYGICLIAILGMTSCAEEVDPTSVATQEQVEKSSAAQQALLYGIPSMMMKSNTITTTYGFLDFGYPGTMMLRDVFCEDFPISDDSYNYFQLVEMGDYIDYYTYYNFVYYYKLIKNANNLIASVGDGNLTADSRNYRGIAEAYRALFYLDLARLYEYKKTGYATIDDKATALGCYGLTVPIVTENTTLKEGTNNPRAPFYKMYRFILNDLKNAETDLKDYKRTDKTMADKSVVYGLMARFWMEVGTRFENSADDLATQLQHENDDDDYTSLGIKTAKEAYLKAADYAEKAINSGYTPMTENDWMDGKTAFNTSTSSWMWNVAYGSSEQIPTTYYWTTLGQLASEPSWGMPQYANAYRMISTGLYKKIGNADWRKNAWVAPTDAKKIPIPSKYNITASESSWKKIPAYANLKFRVRDGELDSYLKGLISELPIMRVEEMFFIKAEAIGRAESVEAGKSVLESFMNNYRYTDGSYKCSANNIDDLVEEILVQKRIEFWGEGLVFFDYKRLNKQIDRTYYGTNYMSSYQIKTKEGYVAPWMNYYIPDLEKSSNPAIISNPNSSYDVATAN